MSYNRAQHHELPARVIEVIILYDAVIKKAPTWNFEGIPTQPFS